MGRIGSKGDWRAGTDCGKRSRNGNTDRQQLIDHHADRVGQGRVPGRATDIGGQITGDTVSVYRRIGEYLVVRSCSYSVDLP